MTIKVHPAAESHTKSQQSSDVTAGNDAEGVHGADEHEAEDGEEGYVYGAFCWGLCCVRGCLLGTIGIAYFLLIIPTGIILVMMGSRNGEGLHLGIGAAVLVAATLVIPASYLTYTYCKRGKDAPPPATRRRHNQVIKY